MMFEPTPIQKKPKEATIPEKSNPPPQEKKQESKKPTVAATPPVTVESDPMKQLKDEVNVLRIWLSVVTGILVVFLITFIVAFSEISTTRTKVEKLDPTSKETQTKK